MLFCLAQLQRAIALQSEALTLTKFTQFNTLTLQDDELEEEMLDDEDEDVLPGAGLAGPAAGAATRKELTYQVLMLLLWTVWHHLVICTAMVVPCTPRVRIGDVCNAWWSQC